MPTTHHPETAYLQRMADGTVKQVNPFTGSQVWTVPGRGNRPLGIPTTQARPLAPGEETRLCAFCSDRYRETPPEKARVVRDGDRWQLLEHLPAAELDATTAEFRRIPNLFEILSYDYWRENYGYTAPEAALARRTAYLADPAGRAHLLAVARAKALASGTPASVWDALDEDARLAGTLGFFAGGHDVVVARRHVVEGATDDGALASSGTLTPDEHHAYMRLAIAALEDLYAANRYVRYVAVFQNWLKAAGASFDHLHKQLVAIDERGVQTELELERLRENPNIYNEAAVNYASYHNLLVAENEHAIALAGFGHRYPTLEVFSKARTSLPFEQSRDEQRAMSDLVHALHAATGASVPTNEEWHHRPLDVSLAMPWRIVLKWRISTLAGFEGGTKIYLNTIDPWALRERVLGRLAQLREEGTIAGGIRLGDECSGRPNRLRYAG